MPPLDTGPLALSQYLTRVLTAIVIENKGEFRIPLKTIRAVEQESSRRMLVEDTNTESDELVLRFGTKHSAVYPVEPQCASTKQQTSIPSQVKFDPSEPQSRKPLTEEQLKALELVQKAMRVRARVKPRPPADSVSAQSELSEILGSNSTS